MVFAVAGRARRRRVGGGAVAGTDGRPNDERGEQNIATNTASPIAGAHQEPNRRFRRSSNGMAATSPSRPKKVVPAAPATKAVPASNPMWCNTCGAQPTKVAGAPQKQ